MLQMYKHALLTLCKSVFFVGRRQKTLREFLAFLLVILFILPVTLSVYSKPVIVLPRMCVFVLFTPYTGWRDDGFYLSNPQIANLNAAKSTSTKIRQIK